MNRLPRTLAFAAAAAFVGALTVGNALLVVAAALAAVASVAWVYRLSRDAPEQPWSLVPADAARALVPEPASTNAVVRALARVEARELVLTPWFAVGLGFCVVMVLSFAPDYDNEPWWEVIDDLPFLVHPLVGMTVLAAHRAATRAERDHADELLATCPAATVRPLAALASAVVPVVALTAFCAASLTAVAVTTDVGGRIGGAAMPQVLAAVVLGSGGVALGHALGRWIRFALAPVIAVVAIGFVTLELADGAPGDYQPRMLLSTVGAGLPEDAPELTASQGWIHLAWIVGITIVTVIVALAGRWPSRRTTQVSNVEPVGELEAVR